MNVNISRTWEALNMRFSPFERGKGVELQDFTLKRPHLGPYFGLQMDLKFEYFFSSEPVYSAPAYVQKVRFVQLKRPNLYYCFFAFKCVLE